MNPSDDAGFSPESGVFHPDRALFGARRVKINDSLQPAFMGWDKVMGEAEARQAMLNSVFDRLSASFDEMTAYLLDYCPARVFWEDFDGDADGVRLSLSETMDRVSSIKLRSSA